MTTWKKPDAKDIAKVGDDEVWYVKPILERVAQFKNHYSGWGALNFELVFQDGDVVRVKFVSVEETVQPSDNP